MKKSKKSDLDGVFSKRAEAFVYAEITKSLIENPEFVDQYIQAGKLGKGGADVE